MTSKRRIHELTISPSTGRTVIAPRVFNVVLTDANQVRVPPGFLITGHSYVFAVDQRQTLAPFSASSAPFYDWLGTNAEAASSVFVAR